MKVIKLPDVVYDVHAKDGTWCTLPYPDHPKGCPNFPECPRNQPDFKGLQQFHEWYALTEEFDLATHAEKMKKKHPSWTERQCRNLLYWQGTLRSQLRLRAYVWKEPDDILLQVPEASGVNVFATLSQVGIILQRQHPNYIVKTMLVGKLKSQRRLLETTEPSFAKEASPRKEAQP